MAAWLTESCKISGTTARLLVRAAAQLESLPHLAAALAEGTLSLDAVAPLADFATPVSDSRLAAASANWTLKQIRELAASHRGTTEAAAARQFEHRSLRFNDAKSTIWAAFTKDDYAAAKAALISRVSWTTDRAAPSGNSPSAPSSGADPLGYVPFDQRLYDAFMSIFLFGGGGGSASGTGTSPNVLAKPATRTATSSDTGTSTAGRMSTGVSTSSGSHPGAGSVNGGMPGFRPILVVHADLGLLTGLDPKGAAEIAGIGQVSQEVARRLACDAKVIFSLEREDGCILDQKRVRRSPTSAQRIEIARRDKGCRFSSCGFIDFTQVHHVVPWVLGGETNLSNLITLCGRHHHAVHELGWSMSGNADGVVTFESPHGHRMTSAPSPTWRRPGTAPMRR
jgi:hypothetical protein